jgi:hypothetical protein
MVYAGSHLHWLAALLLWLYLFHRARFVSIRNVLVASTLLAALFSTLYAVAPPRFAMAGPPYGMEDVMSPFQTELSLVQRSVLDPFASLPSLHVLWALVIGLGLYCTATTAWQRVWAALFPAIMLPTVIVTGNHYVLDCAGSAMLVVVCMLAERVRVSRSRQQLLLQRRPYALVPRFPISERRHNPNLRPLDRPLVLVGTMGVVLAISRDPAQRTAALALLACAAATLPIARHRIKRGVPLCIRVSWADWWSGFLFVAGSTFVGSSDPSARLCGAAMWIVAGLLPLVGRLRWVAGGQVPAQSGAGARVAPA